MRSEIDQNRAKGEFKNFVLSESHACVMAKGLFQSEKIDFHLYDYALGDRKSAFSMYTDITTFIENMDFDNPVFSSFIAAFNAPDDMTELEFEQKLWKQLENLKWVDDCEWDPTVSDDPHSDKFSFSIAGKAFYVVGMHPNSSRKSRQSPFPALVFNLHNQFELLRKHNKFKSVQQIIRTNDKNIQGNINPMLEDFGNSSEARQYSGREVDESWKCPYLSSMKNIS